MIVHNFITKLNQLELDEHFMLKPGRSPYHTYVSKTFYGMRIRSEERFEDIGDNPVIISVRLDGHDYTNEHGDEKPNRISGIKIDVYAMDSPMLEHYDINPDVLDYVDMHIDVQRSHVTTVEPNLYSMFLCTVYDRSEDVTAVVQFTPLT